MLFSLSFAQMPGTTMRSERKEIEMKMKPPPPLPSFPFLLTGGCRSLHVHRFFRRKRDELRAFTRSRDRRPRAFLVSKHAARHRSQSEHHRIQSNKSIIVRSRFQSKHRRFESIIDFNFDIFLSGHSPADQLSSRRADSESIFHVHRSTRPKSLIEHHT